MEDRHDLGFGLPKVIGVVLDLSHYANLAAAKKALVGLAQTLKAATEDKLYVYRPGVKTLNRWVSESVADVANHTGGRLNPGVAIKHTLCVLGVCDPVYNAKHVFYVTDGGTEHRASQVARAAARSDCPFHVLNMGVHDEGLSSFASYTRGPITAELLEGLVNGFIEPGTADQLEPDQGE